MNRARKETILIVDDVPANLEILSSILNRRIQNYGGEERKNVGDCSDNPES